MPAGWYPDPLGLPQLRWWDGQSWTEFTSEAQAPVMMQPSPAPEPAMTTSAPAAAFPSATASGAGYAGTASDTDPAPAVDPFQVAAPFAEPLQPVVASFAEPVQPVLTPVVPAAAVPVVPPEVAAAEAVAAATVNALLGDEAFVSRRERREHERRLAAEAEAQAQASRPRGVDPFAAQAQQPAAYIQQPVIPEVAQPAAFAPQPVAEPVQPAAFQQPAAYAQQAAPGFVPQPVQPIAYASDPNIPIPPMPASYVAEPSQPAQPLQPEPFAREPYHPGALFGHPLVADSNVPPSAPFGDARSDAPTAFAEPPIPAQPAVTSMPPVQVPLETSAGALSAPLDPAPVLGNGLLAIEPALSEILSEAAMAPRPATAPMSTHTSGFDLGDLLDQPLTAAPEPAAATRKPTYTLAAWVLALFSLLQVAVAYGVVELLHEGGNRPIMMVVWFGGLLLAAALANYDQLQLKAAGHARPATGWWALLTPLPYLVARWVRTRRETRKGEILIVIWIIASIAAAGLVYLIPELILSASPVPVESWTPLVSL
ncbi:MAG: DUF2510 domain-containing protein [Microbacteriaceae bacterium]|nr:DUF2510 domain-containing protein [Microbacteriaceae bacterium]